MEDGKSAIEKVAEQRRQKEKAQEDAAHAEWKEMLHRDALISERDSIAFGTKLEPTEVAARVAKFCELLIEHKRIDDFVSLPGAEFADVVSLVCHSIDWIKNSNEAQRRIAEHLAEAELEKGSSEWLRQFEEVDIWPEFIRPKTRLKTTGSASKQTPDSQSESECRQHLVNEYVARITAVGYSVEPEPDFPGEHVELIEKEIAGHYNEFVHDAARGCAERGWQGFELVLITENDETRVLKVKRLHHVLTTIQTSQTNGDFVGFLNGDVDLDRSQCVLVSFDVVGTEWSGQQPSNDELKNASDVLILDRAKSIAKAYTKQVLEPLWASRFSGRYVGKVRIVAGKPKPNFPSELPSTNSTMNDNCLKLGFDGPWVSFCKRKVNFERKAKALSLVSFLCKHGTEGVKRKLVYAELYPKKPVTQNALDQQRKAANDLLLEIQLTIESHPEKRGYWRIGQLNSNS